MPSNLNRHQQLLNFMTEYGRSYLASGGPTSRLEDDLSKLGKKLGSPTEIFATPTGIFISCTDENGSAHTSLARIYDSSINLGKLCWLESIFEDTFSQKISLASASKILVSKHVLRPPYSLSQTTFAAFLSGFSLSYTAFGAPLAAIASGLVGTATWAISGPILKDKIPSSIFRDFIGCLVTLMGAAFFQLFLKSPFEAYSIGGLVVLVPGLSLTTAIAELADQNLVSGTAKLMQAILTLLALVLAYVLFQNFAEAFHILPEVAKPPRPLALGASALGVCVSVSCFGVLFKVPRKSLPWATLTGLLGWFILRQFAATPFIIAACYSASLCVGLLSLTLGQRFKVPSQVFSVPGVLAMLPGMLALNSFRSFATGEASGGLSLGFRVALTAGGIVFGLLTARIPFALIKPPKKKWQMKIWNGLFRQK